MEAYRRVWPTALADACEAKAKGSPLPLQYHDEQLTLTVTSITTHKLGDQIVLKGASIDVVVHTTTGADDVEIRFYPRG